MRKRSRSPVEAVGSNARWLDQLHLRDEGKRDISHLLPYLWQDHLVAGMRVQIQRAHEATLGWMGMDPTSANEIQSFLKFHNLLFVLCRARI